MDCTVAAFDLSLTCTGWAVAYNGSIVSRGRIEPPAIKGRTEVQQVERCILIRSKVTEIINQYGAGLVVFEDFAHAAKGASLHQLAGSAFMIRAHLLHYKVPYVLVAPAALKKFIVGRGGSPKNPVPKTIVIRELFRHFGVEAEEDNEADACGLAFAGMGLMGQWAPTLKGQQEVLLALREKYSNIVKSDSPRIP